MVLQLERTDSQQAARATIQEQFETFDRLHPDVYDQFRHIAYELSRWRSHYGAGAIFEIIRYQRLTSAHGGQPFALNNNFRSRYARKLMAEDERTFGRFFEIRALRST